MGKLSGPGGGDVRAIEISPRRGWAGVSLHEIWIYRDLLRALIVKELKVRYKQTIFGVAWALFQPLATMAVLSVFLGRLAKVPSDGVPYPVFVYSGLVVWQYFAEALRRSTDSLVLNSVLVTKVYFPRLIAPLAGVVTPLLEALIGFALLLVVVLVSGLPLGWSALLGIVFLALAVVAAVAFACWLSALNVEYRDVGAAMPVGLQLWLFLSPVIYPSSLIPERFQIVYALNPISVILDLFRWALLDTPAPEAAHMLVSLGVIAATLGTGLAYFGRSERRFADAI